MAKIFRYLMLTAVILGLLLATTVAIAGCGDSTTTTASKTSSVNSAEILNARALKVLSANPTSGDYIAASISGTKLAAKLADPVESKKLYLMDVRKKADYDAGHIQGTSQVDFAKWASSENLDTLSKLPADTKIIVICYTGNTAAQTTAGLRMLGYDAVALQAGMNGWAQSATTAATVADLQNTSYPDFTTPANPAAPVPPAMTLDKPSADDYKVIAEKANSVMSAMPTDGDFALNTVKAPKLNELLGGSSKPFVLDIRKINTFNAGHIQDAVSVEFMSVAQPDNLKLLPKDKKIVIPCYTGNTSAQTMMILQMLGYDAATLKYGMMGWDGSGKQDYLDTIQSANNPVVKTQ
ncbi:MAG: rhodanese-like domain-containing protein [Thermoleophilia bacterium]